MHPEKNISKLYRYEVLLQAIDFFTQKFNKEQICDYAFKFANEILTLNSSALFIKEEDEFILKQDRNYRLSALKIEDTEKLQRIPVFLGRVITTDFDSFFDKEYITLFGMRIVIPLIIHERLEGFIISNGKALNGFDDDDYVISNAFMRLVNNALENSEFFQQLHETTKLLDKKVFNLNTVHQSSKALFSELNLNNLYTLAIDVFSELAKSKVTSFGIYDEILNKIVVRGYKNTGNFDSYYGEFLLTEEFNNDVPIVLNFDLHLDQIKRIFTNWQDFKNLETQYIVLIVKDKIKGFVTLSQTIDNTDYDESVFELIESLATSTYISLTNALLFKEVNIQKNNVEQKLNILTKLNKLIKNINNCIDLDELCEVLIDTLNIAFNIKKAFIALREDDGYYIKDYVGFKPKQFYIPLMQFWDKMHDNEILYKYSGSFYPEYFDETLIEDIGGGNCLIIAPIDMDKLRPDDIPLPMGYIVILSTPEHLKEEEVLLIDTISDNIASVINLMKLIESIHNEYDINE